MVGLSVFGGKLRRPKGYFEQTVLLGTKWPTSSVSTLMFRLGCSRIAG